MGEAFSVENQKILQEVDDDKNNYATESDVETDIEMTFQTQFTKLYSKICNYFRCTEHFL